MNIYNEYTTIFCYTSQIFSEVNANIKESYTGVRII